MVSCADLLPNQVYTQGGVDVEKQKWGCSVPTKQWLILA